MNNAGPAPLLRIVPVGEAALFCEAAAPADLAVQRRIWAFQRAVRAGLPHAEAVVGMGNLTLMIDPASLDLGDLAEHLTALWNECPPEAVDGPTIEVPLVYGGPAGPDLATVARHAGLSVEEVVRRHAAPLYTVCFMGFQPGFAYLGDLDPGLVTPRRDEPRRSVPAGSAGIGGRQTGIYPLASPGGWQIIGRTAQVLFDPARDPPALLAPGCRVRFVVENILPC